MWSIPDHHQYAYGKHLDKIKKCKILGTIPTHAHYRLFSNQQHATSGSFAVPLESIPMFIMPAVTTKQKERHSAGLDIILFVKDMNNIDEDMTRTEKEGVSVNDNEDIDENNNEEEEEEEKVAEEGEGETTHSPNPCVIVDDQSDFETTFIRMTANGTNYEGSSCF